MTPRRTGRYCYNAKCCDNVRAYSGADGDNPRFADKVALLEEQSKTVSLIGIRPSDQQGHRPASAMHLVLFDSETPSQAMRLYQGSRDASESLTSALLCGLKFGYSQLPKYVRGGPRRREAVTFAAHSLTAAHGEMHRWDEGAIDWDVPLPIAVQRPLEREVLAR